MRIVVHVLGMFVLGAVALVGVGLLYHSRLEQRIPVGAEPPAPMPTGTSGSSTGAMDAPAAAAVAGIRADLDFFADALASGRRSDAMRALDGAYHVADVLQSASDRDPAATSVFDAVLRIRRAVQNGNESSAIQEARNASAHIADVSPPSTARPSFRLKEYVGATVLSPTGDEVGTVRVITAEAVEIESGGLRNLLGFIDLQSGTVRDVPVDMMVFGAPRRFGMSMVLDTTR